MSVHELGDALLGYSFRMQFTVHTKYHYLRPLHPPPTPAQQSECRNPPLIHVFFTLSYYSSAFRSYQFPE